MFGRMKDPVEGTARLAGYVEIVTGSGPTLVMIEAEVIVEADGVPAAPAQVRTQVYRADLPLAPGHVWLARIDRANPGHVKILDSMKTDNSAAEARLQAAREQAGQMAEALRAGEQSGPAAPWGMPGAVGQEPGGVTGDVISRLERLAALRDRGVITEAEFQYEKQQILSQG